MWWGCRWADSTRSCIRGNWCEKAVIYAPDGRAAEAAFAIGKIQETRRGRHGHTADRRREMIKLIVTDVDGTLVQEAAPEVGPEVAEEIRRLTDRGVLFACAGSRQQQGIAALFKDVEDRIVYIAENGAHVRYRDRDILTVLMRQEYVTALVEQLRGFRDCEIVVSTQEESLVETADRDFLSLLGNGYRCSMRIMKDVLSEKPQALRVSAYRASGIRALAEAILVPTWKDRLNVCIDGENWVEFTDLSAGKGNAVLALQSQYGITRSETVAFGNGASDVDMLQAAGESYAVEDAPRYVKEAARFICPSWEKKGVWQILRRLNRVERQNGLEVTFFGNFRITLNGMEVTLDNSTSSKPMQLLEMLLHAQEDGVIREKLQEALYGKGKVTDKTNNMKQTVFRLRKMIEDSILPPAAYIVIKKSYYYWDGELLLDTDTGRFKRALGQAAAEKEDKQKLRYLMEACAQYKGDFLPRLPADGWAGELRVAYKEMYYTALRQLCTILKQEGRYEDMLEVCSNAARLYPHEEWELECLDCLIALERFQEAQDFYRKMASFYADEMHNDLTDELRERHDLLRDRIRNTDGKIEDLQKELSDAALGVQGTYYCTWPNFEGICIQMMRNSREGEAPATLLLCTMLDEKKGVPLSQKKLDSLSGKLQTAILRNLRRSDCFTRYSEHQFLILLVNCDLINSVYAQKRIAYYLEREYGIRNGVRYDTAVLR